MKTMGISVRNMSEIALLTALITITGAVKIPNLIPGIEFQLSAPLAVAVCAVFGFKKYIISGCFSSLIGLALGTQNILNVAIAMQFRLIVGFIVWICRNHMLSVVIAGPVASTVARLTLAVYVGKSAWALVILAAPGMVFTAVMAPVMVNVFKKIGQTAGNSADASKAVAP